MANYRVEDIHTVALVGHEVAGKTSLADALLFKAKAVDRRGSVDEGTSVSDFDEEEKKHKYSIDSALLGGFEGLDLVRIPAEPAQQMVVDFWIASLTPATSHRQPPPEFVG